MKFPQLIVATALVLLSSEARADSWSHSVDFKYQRGASLRIVEPEGFTVELGGKTDTVPAVFNLNNQDSYVLVKVTSPIFAYAQKKWHHWKTKALTISKDGWLFEAGC
jgi:hypothetical protein